MALGVNEQMPILKTSRLSSGISDLDIILEGGYPNPGNIILVGPSGMEKMALAFHFISCAGTSENAYIICGNSSPADIKNKASAIGINLEKDNIYFIDCYSSTLSAGEAKPLPRVRSAPGPGALNDISLAINEAIKESEGKRMRVVFDTLSTFVIYNPQDSIRKFLGVIEGRLKSAGATSLYLIDEGVHDRQTLSLLEHGMDGSYIVLDKGGKYFFTMPELDMPIPIRVGPAGIALL